MTPRHRTGLFHRRKEVTSLRPGKRCAFKSLVRIVCLASRCVSDGRLRRARRGRGTEVPRYVGTLYCTVHVAVVTTDVVDIMAVRVSEINQTGSNSSHSHSSPASPRYSPLFLLGI
jgi:hypothetical protein